MKYWVLILFLLTGAFTNAQYSVKTPLISKNLLEDNNARPQNASNISNGLNRGSESAGESTLVTLDNDKSQEEAQKEKIRILESRLRKLKKITDGILKSVAVDNEKLNRLMSAVVFAQDKPCSKKKNRDNNFCNVSTNSLLEKIESLSQAYSSLQGLHENRLQNESKKEVPLVSEVIKGCDAGSVTIEKKLDFSGKVCRYTSAQACETTLKCTKNRNKMEYSLVCTSLNCEKVEGRLSFAKDRLDPFCQVVFSE